jgi:riboflavin kinase/FMN adenylyltransferase
MSEALPPVDAVPGIDALTTAHGRLFVVVGVFDGLHRGHHYLLRHLRREADRRGSRPAVVTFDHHPDEIVVGTAPPLLCDLDERLVRLADEGVEVTVVQHFDMALRMTPYDRFVEMIRERVDLAGFLMTPDAAFGHERRGTPSALAELGRRDRFDVVVVPPLELDGRPVRSADVRAAVAAGDLVGVRHLLGRSLAVVGERADAGQVPAPRASLAFPIPMALPPAGRYAALVEPAWTPDALPAAPTARTDRAVVHGSASIETDGPGFVVESRRPLPPARRLRVTLTRRLG